MKNLDYSPHNSKNINHNSKNINKDIFNHDNNIIFAITDKP